MRMPHAPVCEQVDEQWVGNFRRWMQARTDRERSPSTIENSVLQLAAAINFAASPGRRDTIRGALFKPQPVVELNRSPTHRSDIKELARMFAYASDPRFPVKRKWLWNFLVASVATLARPDAVLDISTDPDRRQWISNARVLNLNHHGRRQTKKYRATVPISYQVAPWFDRTEGFFIPVQSIRSAWDSMAVDLKLPNDGQSGSKLIRRSMAKLLRDRLRKDDWIELEMFLGHAKFDATSDIYAPFDPNYLSAARKEIEAIIDEIEALVPGAFHRTDSGEVANITPIAAARSA